MSELLPFMVFKGVLVAAALAFAVREVWLLRRVEADPQATRRLMRVMGGAGMRGLSPEAPSPEAAPEPSEPERAEPPPLRRAA